MERLLGQDRLWVACVAAFLTLMTVAGGTSLPSPESRLFFSIVSLALLTRAVWRLRDQGPTLATKLALGLAALVVLLFAIQLVPLPPELHQFLPGRDLFSFIDETTGNATAWSPLSLSPANTTSSLLALLPGLGIFAAALSIPARQRYLLALGIVLLAIIEVLIALAQKFAGDGSFHIYKEFSGGGPSGLFANRNFFAAQLYTSIPMLAVLALSGARSKLIPVWLAGTIAFVYLAVVLVGLGVSNSRAGAILCMAAVIGSLFLPWSSLKPRAARLRANVAFYAGALAILLVSQLGIAGLFRLAQFSPQGDQRIPIFTVSAKAFAAFFPAGSGFGTFVPVYRMFETPETMSYSFVNHAHNDWLEIALEGGAPAILLLAFFVLWFGWTTIRAWRRRGESSADLVVMAASLSAGLLLLHSAVDYPLRTPALMVMFALSMGFLASPLAARKPNFGHSVRKVGDSDAVPEFSRGRSRLSMSPVPLWPVRNGERMS